MTRVVESRFFSAKDPEEVVTLTFEFAALTTAPLTPVVTITRHSGEPDTLPASVASGSPIISGSKVLQQVQGGVDGTQYLVRCEVDTDDGSHYVLSGILPVKSQV